MGRESFQESPTPEKKESLVEKREQMLEKAWTELEEAVKGQNLTRIKEAYDKVYDIKTYAGHDTSEVNLGIEDKEE